MPLYRFETQDGKGNWLGIVKNYDIPYGAYQGIADMWRDLPPYELTPPKYNEEGWLTSSESDRESARFAYTEIGWRKFGMQTQRLFNRWGVTYRILEITVGETMYRDALQEAVIIREAAVVFDTSILDDCSEVWYTQYERRTNDA